MITPAVSGPYDLGNVVVARHSTSTPKQPRSPPSPTPCPRSSRASRCACARSGSTSTGPASPSTRPTAIPSRSTRRSSATRAPQASSPPTSRSPTAPPSPSPPSSPSMLSGATKHAGNPALQTTLTDPAPATANIARPRHPAAHRAHRQRPHQDPAPGSSSPPEPVLPTGLRDRFRRSRDPAARKAPGARSTCARLPENKLPDLVAALNGQIDIALDGKIDTVHEEFHGEKVSRIRTTFQTVPDAPVSQFTLSLDGGDKGLLSNDENICGQDLRATADIAGQNGKTANQDPVLGTSCSTKKRKHSRHARVRHLSKRGKR